VASRPETGSAEGSRPGGGAKGLAAALGPGLLVAATGVGAGDLATAAFTGGRLGVSVLWAVVLGAFLKFVINEGLARWQLATGETLLEGALTRFGPAVRWAFLLYFLLWSFFVGSALISACGATAHAMLPVFEDAVRGKTVLGAGLSLVGLALVLRGGFPLFERVMGACIGVMFVTVLVTAVVVGPEWGAVLRGLLVPTLPRSTEGLGWTVALLGGVGGTVTVLCYGYWIREKGRTSVASLRTCRVDLGVGYAATALFGLAMVTIGSTVPVEGRGAGLVVQLADALAVPLGEAGRWAFLAGAMGAVFSSLLGVWQSAPYIFADVHRLAFADAARPVDTRGRPYRSFLVALALVPNLGLLFEFRTVQKVYAVFGALFIPMLALALLAMNGRREWVGEHRNRPLTTAVLWSAVALFLLFGALGL